MPARTHANACALYLMIGDYKLKAGETSRAVKYSLNTTNLAPNGLCGHQECKTEMTIQRRVACARACVCVGGQCLPRFFWVFFPPLLYVCLMVYGRFHGNNDTLSCLPGLTHGQEAEGNQSSGDRFWPWVAFYFICAPQEASAVLKWLLWPPRHWNTKGACMWYVSCFLFINIHTHTHI